MQNLLLRSLALLALSSIAIMGLTGALSTDASAASKNPASKPNGNPITCSLPPGTYGQPMTGQDWSRAKVVRHLLGPEAIAYIAGKESGDPAFRTAQTIAAEKLRQRGFWRTNIAVVTRIEVPKAKAQATEFDFLTRLWRSFMPTLNAEEIDGYDVIISILG